MLAGISRLGLGCNAAITPSPVYVLTAALGSTASDSFRISYGERTDEPFQSAHCRNFPIGFQFVSLLSRLNGAKWSFRTG